MRRHDNALSERNAAALRRLAIIGSRLAEDRRPVEPAARDESPNDPVDAPADDPAALAESPTATLDVGRHVAPAATASRSRPAVLSAIHDRLPMSVHARLGGAGLTAHHVVVVVAVVVGFVALAAWWLVSSQPSEVTPLTTAESSPVATANDTQSASDDGDSESAPAEESASPAATDKVVVDVTGKVRKPGIVSLQHGARVADAIEAAGGPTNQRVDMRALNLARVLTDGEQIVVGLPALAGATAPPVGGTSTTGSGTTTAGTPVNLNTATLEQLETLPGVGPVTGQAMIDWRTENGQFTSVDELLEVDGIGEVTLEELRELVTI